jgi:hypothetical protein
MSLNQFKESECVLTTQKHCPCVEFLLADTEAAHQHRHGFHTSQLLHYRLEPDDGGESGHEPAEKLTLAFATADVVILGWRLERLAELLRDGDLLAVRALPSRYANLDRNKTYVASITVEPVSKG